MKPNTIKLSEIIMKYGCSPYNIMDAVRDGELHHKEDYLFDRDEVEKWYKEKIKKVTGGRI